jgi:GTP-binding protein
MHKNVFNKTRFHQCVDSTHKLDSARSELAFVGRSNAGKSSLVNALCGGRLVAKTSKTPGKTRTINVFSILEGIWLVDLPGYGFAAVHENEKNNWKTMIEDYFSSRPSLKAIFVIIDAHVGATKLDMQMFAWLESTGIDYRIVVNKIDRVSQARIIDQRKNLALSLDVTPEHIIWVSAKKGTGIDELHPIISEFLETNTK